MDDLAKYLGKYAFFYSEFWKVKKNFIFAAPISKNKIAVTSYFQPI